ncbi:tRNA (adenosine(37)-N6)-threonylcarbamoyltransferase complex transferase subunit TsaD [Kosmotoga pacifica]|uniref:tRNA N6-adenosine threonylcarbamoyltransferase n=1 Tax=Kosmotoga pacifica TaxID=1330330 RepID=A0A0G2Z911_9BACT|nr:tRNA (adenosine(37)-N6)-threonylcarbamoyltransferase complex transferase subunit TsaD [Kosmotoga pacifica]AKI98047.1 protein kinase [Kosmotoga pacifica]
MKVLAIESSCDETAVAIVEDTALLSNTLASQIDIHKKYGGVVPEIAARHHLEILASLVDETLERAGLSVYEIDVFAATYGPGLVGSLLVGLSFAKALALALGKPFVAVNHLHGHLYANLISFPDLNPPFLVLLVSGGHTELFFLNSWDSMKRIGKTRDDAAGEAFDKVARLLGLGYPGGPEIERIAKSGEEKYNFPRSLREKGNYDFSFSGLKTSVLYFMRKNPEAKVEDIAASFQAAVVDSLLSKTFAAAAEYGVKEIVFAGGVAANRYLRNKAQVLSKDKYNLYFPPIELCTDNAAMIAMAAYNKAKRGEFSPLDTNAVPYLQF